MALKPDRDIKEYEIRYYLDQTAVKGKVVCLLTGASGVSMDGTLNQVEVSAAPSGKVPVGVLLEDFIDIDVTRYDINRYKLQAQVGSKASIARKGWLVTDQVYPSASATAGSWAVLANSGYIMNAPTGWNVTHTNFPLVGKFKTNKDTDGFVTVEINI